MHLVAILNKTNVWVNVIINGESLDKTGDELVESPRLSWPQRLLGKTEVWEKEWHQKDPPFYPVRLI